MFFYADLHIHSKYSRATSKSCNLEELAIWAQKKGLSVISTGDFTHPAWFAEIKEKLVPAGNGVFRLRPEIEKQILKPGIPVYFVLSVEISTIYKKWDRTRKVHHVVFVPDLEAVQNFREKLGAIGNINSDGRPILGLDSRNLLETALEAGEGSFIIPAHIWTPWFSVLGSKSGFDSIDDCYGDLAEHIFAVETGLSSDPEMNWHVSSLDKYRLVSNSDAHSPAKLAREATVFDTNPDYFSMMKALKTGEGYVGTVEFFPEEGKYHDDGHRKCNVCLTPAETKKLNGICPVCGKPLTIGVANRVYELSDRKGGVIPPKTAGKVISLVPLPEILSEIMQVGPSSKSVTFEYENLIQKLGSELSILTEVPVDEIEKIHSPLLAEGIKRLRKGQVIRQAGYDGEYGVIKLFEEGELVKKNFTNLKLDIEIPEPLPAKTEKSYITGKTVEFEPIEKPDNKKPETYALDEFQEAAVKNNAKRLLIVAGPGSGKTTVLTRRIANFIKEKAVEASGCLAITFTRRAAQEMKDRLKKLLPDDFDLINIHTFHSLCFSILKENASKAGLSPDFKVISEQEKAFYKDELKPGEMIDFDSLISLTVKLFEENPQIKEDYRKKFKFVSVDEYQDIDENQYRLIRLLVPQDGSICAIGDPNQAIYGFRGGDSRFFNSFSEDYPDSLVVNLKNNYRSTNTIVDASNQMIESYNIISRYDKPHEKITIHTAPTDKAEAEFVVSTIESMIGGNSFFSLDSDRADGFERDFSFGDFAVLYRTSSQLEPLLEAFGRSGMPFVKLSNDMLCDKKPVKKLLMKLNDENPLAEQLEGLSKEFADEIDDNILRYLQKTAHEFTDRMDFIHQISLVSEADTLDERADRIALMTLHASKGLEYKCVFIVGLEDGILPLFLAKTPQELEEERRLLYVGMTRAQNRLFLSHATRRMWRGKPENLEISPFLEKIKSDLLKMSTFEKTYKEKDNTEQLKLF